MRIRSVSSLVILLFLLLSIAGGASAETRGASKDEAAILQVIHETCRAYLEADAKRIAELVAEDFTLTDADGVVTTRADDIENAKKGTIRYEVFENVDMKVRLYGDSAVVLGRTNVKGKAGETPFAAVFQFTDTMVRRDGRWWFAASHISRLP